MPNANPESDRWAWVMPALLIAVCLAVGAYGWLMLWVTSGAMQGAKP